MDTILTMTIVDVFSLLLFILLAIMGVSMLVYAFASLFLTSRSANAGLKTRSITAVTRIHPPRSGLPLDSTIGISVEPCNAYGVRVELCCSRRGYGAHRDAITSDVNYVRSCSDDPAHGSGACVISSSSTLLRTGATRDRSGAVSITVHGERACTVARRS